VLGAAFLCVPRGGLGSGGSDAETAELFQKARRDPHRSKAYDFLVETDL
jgi:hypothetical protein